MIPEYNVDLRRKVNTRRIVYPPKKFLTYEDGLVANHEYNDSRGITWDNFRKVFPIENNWIIKAGSLAKDATDFERIFQEFDDEALESEADFFGMEPGIASLTFAVSAFGGAPVSSCRHHPERSNEEQPYVAFWCRKKMAKNLAEIAKRQPIGIENYDIENYGGLIIWGRNILNLLDFSHRIYNFSTGRNLKCFLQRKKSPQQISSA